MFVWVIPVAKHKKLQFEGVTKENFLCVEWNASDFSGLKYGGGPHDGLEGRSPFDQRDEVCFDRLVTGSIKENYPLRTKEWDYNNFAYADKRAFRDFYVANVGVDPSYQPPKQHVVIIAKDGPRVPSNLLQVEAFVRETFNVSTQIVPNMAGLNARVQVELMARATVVITPCGGVSKSAIFMSPGGAAVFAEWFNEQYNISGELRKRSWHRGPSSYSYSGL